MTDNEIIQALECCFKTESCGHCLLYSADPDIKGCTSTLSENALDLISRQKTEIEKLEIELKAMRGAANSYKAENERLQNHIKNTLETLVKQCVEREVKTAKSEAIKEFAEKLKNHIIEVDVSFGYGKECYTEAVPLIEIENLVKEMTEAVTRDGKTNDKTL